MSNQVNTDAQIYNAVEVEGKSKAEVGREFGVSARTVGRAIERHLKNGVPTPVKKPKAKTPAKKQSDSSDQATMDETIHSLVVDGGETKASVARQFGISTRTVGRAIERHEALLEASGEAVDEEDEIPNRELNFIISGDFIEIMDNSDGMSISIPKDHEKFDQYVSEIVANRDDPNEVLNTIFEENNLKKRLESFNVAGFEIDVENETVSFEGKRINSLLSRRLLEAAQSGDASRITALANLSHRIEGNVSYRVVQNLFKFLDHQSVTIEEDGSFLCYKGIRSDGTDRHSGSIDNSPVKKNQKDSVKTGLGREGEVTVTVMEGRKYIGCPRNKVNDNNDETCSNGLHVCTTAYFGDATGSYFSKEGVIVVRVAPEDVVSIPNEYHSGKMRTCAYEVVCWSKDYSRTVEEN